MPLVNLPITPPGNAHDVSQTVNGKGPKATKAETSIYKNLEDNPMAMEFSNLFYCYWTYTITNNIGDS